jgi:O-acetyl-ADP-ribose deacetylase (regulator of RNase III)
MIEYLSGDILESEAQALVNPVNCVGVMGKGLALQFKQRYPANYIFYERACREGRVRPGHMLVFELEPVVPGQRPQLIINFPTKRHWRDESLLVDIHQGLDALAFELIRRRIRHVALPALGCGLGGLAWADVKELIEDRLAQLEQIRIVIIDLSLY